MFGFGKSKIEEESAECLPEQVCVWRFNGTLYDSEEGLATAKRRYDRRQVELKVEDDVTKLLEDSLIYRRYVHRLTEFDRHYRGHVEPSDLKNIVIDLIQYSPKTLLKLINLVGKIETS